MHKKRGEEARSDKFKVQLYITGASANSSKAITNLRSFFAAQQLNDIELEIIDVHQNPALAKSENIIALPLLVKKNPLPEARLIGDLSDSAKLDTLFKL